MSIKESSFIKETIRVINDMWLKGWDERNGGNLSYRLVKDEVEKYKGELKGNKTVKLFGELKELAGEYFLVTGSGKYFKNVIIDPEANLGIIRISEDGKYYTILWGFSDGANPTSEFQAHLLSHIERMKVTEGKNRVVMHAHATNLIALSYILDLTTENFTKQLWKMSTECLVVFPDGIGVIPWMIPGKEKIARATAKEMSKHSMVLWPFHGIFGTGKDLDEAFGLIDTVEKAATILVKVLSMGGQKQTISDEELKALAEGFRLKALEGIL